MEIALLIVGAVIFIVSFIVPVKAAEAGEEVKELVDKTVKDSVASELKNVSSHVEDVVDEAIQYAQEKTERSLERLSNEKIMAVSEYGDTVLDEIHKNHDEVMFLYDMLNDKHQTLKGAVSEAQQAAKAVEESAKEAEAVVSEMKQITPEPVAPAEPVIEPVSSTPAKSSGTGRKVRTLNWAVIAEQEAEQQTQEHTTEDTANFVPTPEVIEPAADFSEEQQRNEKILSMYRDGMQPVDIARTLAMGVGEVQLIIGLYSRKG